MTADIIALMGRKRPHSSGFRNRRIRDYQTLPYGWDELTTVDIEQLKGAVRAILDRDADLFELEACLLLWSALTTGRSCRDLLPLRLHAVSSPLDWAAIPPALVKDGEQWVWWLKVEAPDQKRGKAGMLPLSDKIYLPATDMIVDIIERCLAKRKVMPGQLSRTLFTHWDKKKSNKDTKADDVPLVMRMIQILAHRNPEASRQSREATTSTASLTRWLRATLNEAAGGDTALTAAICGDIPSMARTSSAYGAVTQDRLARHYRSAISHADTVSPVAMPAALAGTHIGGRLTPADETVSNLVMLLAGALETASCDVAAVHRAMTRYTVGLLSFALAHRGTSGTLPALKDVDAHTRFYWLVDKNVRGKLTRRMVWLCDTAMEQLRLYDRHVADVEKMLPEWGQDIRAIRQEPGLPLFGLRPGKIERISVKAAIGDVMSVQGLPKNAGRHWLRAQLVGQCSTETIHAFYGHGPLESGSWDAVGTLDPAIYRADIARVLDSALRAAGWVPRGAHLRVPAL